MRWAVEERGSRAETGPDRFGPGKVGPVVASGSRPMVIGPDDSGPDGEIRDLVEVAASDPVERIAAVVVGTGEAYFSGAGAIRTDDPVTARRTIAVLDELVAARRRVGGST